MTEAYKISALNGAIYPETANETGSKEQGKLSDMVLINGDLEKIIRSIRTCS